LLTEVFALFLKDPCCLGTQRSNCKLDAQKPFAASVLKFSTPKLIKISINIENPHPFGLASRG